ncbi:MAG: uroporphyrinogen-III synthase [Candidatus Eremiobacteraeota bacterium]|nr:uroporphyrinogen-III synthase [Candidatus Eremiobacteraeota bacterium]
MTRASDQNPEFIRLLEEQGAQVASLPLIAIGPPPNERAFQDAVNRADAFDWIIFTSGAGVRSFAQRRPQPLKAEVQVAAIGPATDQAVTQWLHVRADVIPAQFSGGALADAIAQRAKAQHSMLIVAAQDASPVLAGKLRDAGYSVEKVDAYTTIEAAPPNLAQHVAASDVITLASPSAVRALARGLGEGSASALRGKLLACLGPVTLMEARQRGLHVEIVPDAATFSALVDALCRYYTTPHS